MIAGFLLAALATNTFCTFKVFLSANFAPRILTNGCLGMEENTLHVLGNERVSARWIWRKLVSSDQWWLSSLARLKLGFEELAAGFW